MFIANDQPDLSVARTAWAVLEPYNAMIYFAPEAREAYKEVGLKGFWMGYFASRAAPLGAVSASVVTATFYNFHPRMVARAIPDAWKFSTPECVWRARVQAADKALRRLLGESIASHELAEAAQLAREAVVGCSVIGRTLFAAYSDMKWPEEPYLVLWHAATLLREYRGDGHIVALLGEGVDGCEAHVLQGSVGNIARESIQPHRGWSDEDWQAAEYRMRQRGLLDKEGRATASGKALHRAIENRTDWLALPPWQHLGEEKYKRLIELVRPLSTCIVDQGGVPMPNPMGSPRP